MPDSGVSTADHSTADHDRPAEAGVTTAPPGEVSDPPFGSATELETERLLREACEETDATRAARLRDQVVLLNRSFALGLAHRFDHRGVERADLEQVALLGLIHAARRYRPEYGRGFAAFAAPTIMGELKRYFRDHGWGVRPPRSLQELHLDVRSAVSSLTQELGREPDDNEVAVRLSRSVAEVRRARSVEDGYRWTSLEAPLGGHEDLTLGDAIADDEAGFELVEDRVSLRPLLQELSPREQLIIRLRFVDELTQRQIGSRIGVSQMQVSRLLTSILGRLRQRLTAPPPA